MLLVLLISNVFAGDIDYTQPKKIDCCGLIQLRWTYSSPGAWFANDTVSVEIWHHHALLANEFVATIVSKLNANFLSSPGFDWTVPQVNAHRFDEVERERVFSRAFRLLGTRFTRVTPHHTS
jgi:hypothetical protein